MIDVKRSVGGHMVFVLGFHTCIMGFSQGFCGTNAMLFVFERIQPKQNEIDPMCVIKGCGFYLYSVLLGGPIPYILWRGT